MDPKAQRLLAELSPIFPDGNVEYVFGNSLHKFRLNRNGPSQWLYVSPDYLDDHTEEEVVASFAAWRIHEAFRTSDKSRWLFLSESGVKEVDADFGRGHKF